MWAHKEVAADGSVMKASCAFQLLRINATGSILPQEYSVYTVTLEYCMFTLGTSQPSDTLDKTTARKPR